MERVLELVAPGADAPYEIIVQSLSSTVLRVASDQQKHKLKVRVSALLRASGSPNASRERVLGALLARKAIVDWSVLHSHGSSWVSALLHMLTLPQKTGWVPALRSLIVIFDRVHGKADLSREIAGAKVGDFAKKLGTLLDKSGAPVETICSAIQVLAPQFEPHFRPSIDMLTSKLDAFATARPNAVVLALAALTLAEKQTAESWTRSVGKVLTELKNKELTNDEWINGARTTWLFALLAAYLDIAGRANAKVDATSLMAIIDESLQSLKASRVLVTLKFMFDTRDVLATVYMRRFDRLLYVLAECGDISTECFIYTAKLLSWLFNAIGPVLTEHSAVISRIAKRALAVLEDTTPIGAAGLADLVKTPKAFNSVPAQNDVLVVSQLLQSLIISVAKLPQSLRARMDRFLLTSKDTESIRISSLYPGRFTIAPMAISGTDMVGYEAIVHPRLPALGVNPLTARQIESEQEESEAEVEEIRTDDPQELDAPMENDQTIESETVIVEAATPREPAPLPKIDPMPIFESKVQSPESEMEPPLKKSRSDPIEEDDLTSHDIKNVGEENPSTNDNHDDGDDDDFVLPTLIL